MEPGWQLGLAAAIRDAKRLGQKQVVLLFSRHGCPKCERMKPVLCRAIQSRAKDILFDLAGGEMVFVGGVGLTLAPLRVFVLHAGEFPILMHICRIKAFPTSLFLGQPGVGALLAQGLLSDEQVAEILHAAAVAEPPMEGQMHRRERPWLCR